MPETPQQYIRRILAHAKGANPRKLQAAAVGKLERLVKGVAPARLRKRPAPGTPIQAFDQDAWAAALRYEKRDARAALAQFRALREANLALLKSLSPEQWNHFGLHAERGQESIRHIARLHAGHDLNHLRQIESILRPANHRSRRRTHATRRAAKR